MAAGCARYNTSMNRASVLTIVFAVLFSLVPSFAYAQGMPLLSSGWSLVPEACRSCPCGFAGVMGTAQNLLNAAISVGILFAIIIIAWAGFILVMSPFNAEGKSQARGMLINAAIGLLIVLSAWLIVDFVMKVLYSGEDGQQGAFGPWNSILTGGDTCVSSVEVRPLFSGTITADQLSTTNPGGISTLPNGAGSGACLVRTSGACDYENFISAFGSEAVARQASQICYEESKGVTAAISDTDVMKNDPQKRAFSFGLFQINLTWHEVNGLPCPSAFEGKNYTARVKNEELYKKCVAAAKTFDANVKEAVATYKRTGWKEWSTAAKCRLADVSAPERFMAAAHEALARGVSLFVR